MKYIIWIAENCCLFFVLMVDILCCSKHFGVCIIQLLTESINLIHTELISTVALKNSILMFFCNNFQFSSAVFFCNPYFNIFLTQAYPGPMIKAIVFLKLPAIQCPDWMTLMWRPIYLTVISTLNRSSWAWPEVL